VQILNAFRTHISFNKIELRIHLLTIYLNDGPPANDQQIVKC